MKGMFHDLTDGAGSIVQRYYEPTGTEYASEDQGDLVLKVIAVGNEQTLWGTYRTCTVRPFRRVRPGQRGHDQVAGEDLDLPMIEALTDAFVGQDFVIRPREVILGREKAAGTVGPDGGTRNGD